MARAMHLAGGPMRHIRQCLRARTCPSLSAPGSRLRKLLHHEKETRDRDPILLSMCGRAVSACCSRLVAPRTGSPKKVRNLWRRAGSWNLPLSMHRTPLAATGHKDAEAQPSRSQIRSISPSLTNLPCAKSSPMAHMELRCRPSLKTREECSPINRLKRSRAGSFPSGQKKGILNGSDKPAYAARNPGTAASGELVYRSCASCHGPGGRGGPKGSSITNYSFLALMSDQELRTIVIAGRPRINCGTTPE